LEKSGSWTCLGRQNCVLFAQQIIHETSIVYRVRGTSAISWFESADSVIRSSDQELAEAVLLNPDILDNYAIAMPHITRGEWMANLIPVKALGSDLGVHVEA
jgi:hypothetical protein